MDEYLANGGNGGQAAKKIFNTTTDNSARATASEVLTKPSVRAYLEEKAHRAAEIVNELAEGSDLDTVRLNAAKDILDRTGHKIPEVQPTEKGNVYNFLFSDSAKEDIAVIEARIKAKLLGDVQEN